MLRERVALLTTKLSRSKNNRLNSFGTVLTPTTLGRPVKGNEKSETLQKGKELLEYKVAGNHRTNKATVLAYLKEYSNYRYPSANTPGYKTYLNAMSLVAKNPK